MYSTVCGLSATSPHPKPRIIVCTMSKDIGMPSKPVLVGNHPHMSVREDNTTPISNDGVQQHDYRANGVVASWTQVGLPVGADLRFTGLVQWGQASLQRGYQAGLFQLSEALNPELGLA